EMIRAGDVKKFLTGFTSFLKGAFLYTYKSLLQSWLLVALILAVVIGAGYVYQQKKPAYYEAEMVCAYNQLHKKTFGEMVHRLDKLAEQQSYGQLAELLQLPMETASAIIGFEAKNVAGSPLYEDITTDRTPMYFTLRATDKSIFPDVEKALLFYLNHIPYQTQRTALEQKKTENKILLLKNDLSKMDSVISAYSNFLQRTKSVTDSAAGFSNIVELFRYKDQLEDKMLELEKNKTFIASVETIYGFAPADTPVKNNRNFWIGWIAFAGILSTAAAVLRKIIKDE
ncbi:MAG TPA: hypothetical protein VFM90_01205, partial [Cyclobacteriaceae bacterium]|nr:hypothetical protein [Cyclobacteriaceae bacterium]